MTRHKSPNLKAGSSISVTFRYKSLSFLFKYETWLHKRNLTSLERQPDIEGGIMVVDEMRRLTVGGVVGRLTMGDGVGWAIVYDVVGIVTVIDVVRRVTVDDEVD